MMRVKNEEMFLYASVQSIIDHVDEIVLVDNLSTDRTPAIIADLCAAHPEKVVSYRYPYEIRKVGRENWELAENPKTRHSPHLSSTYYNWCLRKCTMPFVLKWDGDMVAREAFYASLAGWHTSGKPVMRFNGANVHPDRKHLIAAKTSDREALLASLSVPGLPKWVTVLTYDFEEPRLFPRAFARFDNKNLWTQQLAGPFRDRRFAAKLTYKAEAPQFLHFKFCKPDPLSNYSPDLKAVVASNVTVGPPLDPEARRLVQHWQLDARPASAYTIPFGD